MPDPAISQAKSDRSARADASTDPSALGDPIEAWKIRGRELNAIYDALTTVEGKSKTGDAAADVMVLGEERDRLRAENERYRTAIKTALDTMAVANDQQLGPGGVARKAYAGLWHAYFAIPAGIESPPASDEQEASNAL